MKKVVVVLIILVITLSLLGVPKHFFRKTYEVEVTDKYIKRKKGKKSFGGRDIYMVETMVLSTGKPRVFRNTDSFWELKWRSSDKQAEIMKGKKYRLRVYGYRLGILSKYQNIVRVELL